MGQSWYLHGLPATTRRPPGASLRRSCRSSAALGSQHSAAQGAPESSATPEIPEALSRAAGAPSNGWPWWRFRDWKHSWVQGLLDPPFFFKQVGGWRWYKCGVGQTCCYGPAKTGLTGQTWGDRTNKDWLIWIPEMFDSLPGDFEVEFHPGEASSSLPWKCCKSLRRQTHHQTGKKIFLHRPPRFCQLPLPMRSRDKFTKPHIHGRGIAWQRKHN